MDDPIEVIIRTTHLFGESLKANLLWAYLPTTIPECPGRILRRLLLAGLTLFLSDSLDWADDANTTLVGSGTGCAFALVDHRSPPLNSHGLCRPRSRSARRGEKRNTSWNATSTWVKRACHGAPNVGKPQKSRSKCSSGTKKQAACRAAGRCDTNQYRVLPCFCSGRSGTQ